MSATLTTTESTAAPVPTPAGLVVRGCPNCGSARLRAAPAVLLSPLMTSLSGRKRYGCSDCKWRGWKVPLPRRGKAKPRPFLHRQVSPAASALVVVVSVIAVILISFQDSCGQSPERVNGGGPASVVQRNPLW